MSKTQAMFCPDCGRMVTMGAPPALPRNVRKEAGPSSAVCVIATAMALVLSGALLRIGWAALGLILGESL